MEVDVGLVAGLMDRFEQAFTEASHDQIAAPLFNVPGLELSHTKLLLARPARHGRAMPVTPVVPASFEIAPEADLKSPSRVLQRMYTADGHAAIMFWFHSLVDADGLMPEKVFVPFMRELTNLPDHEILSLFDVFDSENAAGLDYEQFFLVLSVCLAVEASRLQFFWHRHGRTTYDIISKGVDKVLLEQMLDFPTMLRLDSRIIMEELEALGLRSSVDSVAFEDFNLFMYSVFSRHDRGLDLHTDRINNGGQRSGTRRRGSDASSTFNTSRGIFATPRVAGYTELTVVPDESSDEPLSIVSLEESGVCSKCVIL